jgi:RNA polymerase sigma-70 factor (ECF subfamily)
MNYKEYGDQELAKIIGGKRKKNKQAAFSEIYSRYGKMIYAYILRMLKNNESDANDIFQDTMLAFYKYAQTTYPESVKAVLITLARNQTLNFFRKHKRIITKEFSEEIETETCLPVIGENIDYKCIVEEALACLPDDMREIFVLKYYMDYSYDEISTITGIPNVSLRQLVFRANDKLRTILKPIMQDYIFDNNERQK